MRDLAGMMKQAQELQKKLQDSQAEMERLTVEGVSGGGLVRLTLKGSGELATISLDSTLLKADEGEILEDLIIAAFNDAKKKADEAKAAAMKSMTAGMSLPAGMKLPF